MTAAEATPAIDPAEVEALAHDRAFLGHPKGLGYLGFVEGCERFSYYSMQTLLVLYMTKYLLLPEHMSGVMGLNWVSRFTGLHGQPLASKIFGTYTSLVYLTPIAGGIIADRWLGRRATLIAGGLIMSVGHFLMAIEGAFLFALASLIVGVGLFKGNIASQVGELYGDNDDRRGMAFQIFYIFINVSVIVAPLISGTLGQEVSWHYGFGTAGIVMVAGLLIYLKAGRWLPADNKPDRAAKQRGDLGDRFAPLLILAAYVAVSWLTGYWTYLAGPALAAALYLYVRRDLKPGELPRLIALLLLVPALAIALLTNQEIFNAYLVWADAKFTLTLFGMHFPSSWMITIDATLSFTMLVAVALFWTFLRARTGKEPDEITKMIIGSVFIIAGGLCLYIGAVTAGSGKVAMFWPLMFHLINSIGFGIMMPVSLALFSKLAPKAINATVIGIYYLAFVAANYVVGVVGGWYSTMPTPEFWLIHVASAVVGLVAFVVFKLVLGRHIAEQPAPAAG